MNQIDRFNDYIPAIAFHQFGSLTLAGKHPLRLDRVRCDSLACHFLSQHSLSMEDSNEICRDGVPKVGRGTNGRRAPDSKDSRAWLTGNPNFQCSATPVAIEGRSGCGDGLRRSFPALKNGIVCMPCATADVGASVLQ